MELIASPEELQTRLLASRLHERKIVFVPTMGNLHAGHLKLVDIAKTHGQIVVVSIFVNPLQFGVNEDFSRYPRTMQADCEQLRAVGTDIVFTPETDTIYPHGMQQASYVEVPGISGILEGAHRPGHFRGVATVVAKLFNLVQPQVAVFGEKDCQQLLVIRQMVHDLNFPITIIGVPTVREADGLAMSSRNGYLSAAERARAPIIYQTLCHIRDRIQAGARDYPALETEAHASLVKSGFVPDYVAIRNNLTLAMPQYPNEGLVILSAARLGTTRLIDNLAVGPI